MMNRYAALLLIACTLVTGVKLSGQQKTDTKHAAKAKPKPFIPPVYIGNSDFKGGPIQKDKFNELMRQGLTSHDSLGNKYTIIGFDFSYGEKKVYEDSVGNLIKLTDLFSEHYPGSMIGADMATDADLSVLKGADTLLSGDMELTLSLYQRVKPGDTIFFDHVTVKPQPRNTMKLSDTTEIWARGIMCYIVK